MRIKDMIELLKKEKAFTKCELENRKDNINHNYFMAQLDFKVIENMEDVIETLDTVIEDLNDCQQRIIERNR